MKVFAPVVAIFAAVAAAEVAVPIMPRQMAAPANSTSSPPPFGGASAPALVSGASFLALGGAFAAGAIILA